MMEEMAMKDGALEAPYLNYLADDERRAVLNWIDQGIFTNCSRVSRWVDGKFYFGFAFSKEEQLHALLHTDKERLPSWIRDKRSLVEVYSFMKQTKTEMKRFKDAGRYDLMVKAARELLDLG
jgi:hypothetical protein